ncbi:unnamed protein product [Chironomus riparius]|uniref:Uncharacterized protein n=1 Tax=Chironomus riparius TaxID=315576 RepID=A0A9N9S100_9DIPT|nr:unnamed protein product [Chironomus riparius]
MFCLQIFIGSLILICSTFCQNCERNPNNASMCTFSGIQRSMQMDELTDSNPDEIKRIKFVNSFINRIPIKLTEIYKNLVDLDVSNSLVCVLRDQYFKGGKLQKLNASGNVISYLESNINNVLQNLEVLDLSRNRIQVLEDNVFYYFTKLKYLNLSHNEIKKLPANFTSYTDNVNVLDLGNNQISSLAGDFSSKNSRSNAVNLSNNLLVSIDPMSFKNLFRLNINFNKLEKIINFQGTNIKELLICGNSLQLLIINKQLVILDVSYNNGNSLEIDFGSESALECLKLSNLKLFDYTDILANISKLNNLMHLDLSMSNLTTFDFDNNMLPKSIKVLNLMNTQLKVLKNFKNILTAAPNLKEIILNGNFLKDKELWDISKKFGINVTGLEITDETITEEIKTKTILFSDHNIIIIVAVSMNILLFIINLYLTATLHA